MCLIVDANQAHIVFGQPDSPAARPIWKWLEHQRGRLSLGGRLADELAQLTSSRRLLAELNRRGWVFVEKRSAVDEEEKRILAAHGIESDDPHILALARISGARVVATEDRALWADLKNRALLQPAAKIYRQSRHHKLLTHRAGCRGPR